MIWLKGVIKCMEYGIIFWENTDNLGDDIQTYAASKFLPKIDYYIDREKMDTFYPKSGKKISVIMNGWFLHQKFHFPPSPYINPLCISMHFSKYDAYELGYTFLDGAGRQWLCKNGPIGCRDISTLQACRERHINAYLSGCLTLTLPRQPKQCMEYPYICTVDLPDQDTEKIRRYASQNDMWVIAKTHIRHSQTRRTFKEAMDEIESLLTLYQNAHCVITTRLHCALPCLAMGVPVLLIIDKTEPSKVGDLNRFDIFLNMLHTTSPMDFRNGTNKFNILVPPDNKELYKTYRRDLIRRVNNFINSTSIETKENFIDLEEQKAIKEWQDDMKETALSNSMQRINYLLGENSRINDLLMSQERAIQQIYTEVKRKNWQNGKNHRRKLKGN